MSATEDAATELKSFLDKYPDSPYRDKSTDILKKVGKRLADHEWYVARYYWDRGKPMGTVVRLSRLLARYRGVGYDEEAMWLLGRAYVAVSRPDRAKGIWSELVEKYPKSSRAGDAKAALAELPKSAPSAPASGPANPPPTSPGATPAPVPAAPKAPAAPGSSDPAQEAAQPNKNPASPK